MSLNQQPCFGVLFIEWVVGNARECEMSPIALAGCVVLLSDCSRLAMNCEVQRFAYSSQRETKWRKESFHYPEVPFLHQTHFSI